MSYPNWTNEDPTLEKMTTKDDEKKEKKTKNGKTRIWKIFKTT